MRRKKLNLPLLLVIVFFCVYPFFSNFYWIDVAFFFGVYALLGLSLNIVLGETGLFDLGHAAFYAIGAYVTAILNTSFGIPVIWLLPVSALAAGLFAYIVTSPIIHLRGDYLCVVTIGIGEIVRLALINNPFKLTGGPNGITGIMRPSFGLFAIDTSIRFYFYVWGILAIFIICLIRLQRSRIGRAWNYLREDEIAAEMSGVDVRRFKLLAFVLGAALAGVAGNIYASKLMIVSPDTFTFLESSLLFCIVMLGGLGSIPGSVLGAGIITIFPEIFRVVANYRMLFFGGALVITMIFRPGGIWPRKREVIALQADEASDVTEDIKALKIIDPMPTSNVATNEDTSIFERHILVTDKLTMAFGGLVAVKDLDLVVGHGKITSIIGPNGAGKTTVFNVVTGIYKPVSGKVYFEGKDITGLKPHQITSLGIARTFQNIRLFPNLTCIENVMAGLHYKMKSYVVSSILRTDSQKTEEKWAFDTARYWLMKVGLGNVGNELAKNLPYGKQKMLELARALSSMPRLLILDEPSSGLNDRETEDLMIFLENILDELDISILLIEHDMNLVMGISHWVVAMDMGMKIAEGRPSDIYNHPRVIEAYLGREE
ncbi:MAG TPA: branched-chain amino acid ABC transporter ATP-binding protein/permease [Acetomicrobium flavidum]|uniref:branched-chain amino acid ABC transporter ATP-binding protein/permease n=1 Tax=Acetomicrobium flavidum TaxID=49896 RepID=UPI002C24D532|nr:branched-chain amino acid ABC transporter ATP-binding protein/permease [Acetomicrobium flavidum]HPU69225.1 branched-chain amino acid ABC transporter ATP-binding protein/permease [Acetomicrobium flavidum]